MHVQRAPGGGCVRESDPGMQMPYNPPYYSTLIEGRGLSKVKDLWQWYLSTSTPIPERVVRISDKIRQRNKVVVRPMDLGKWDDEVARVIEAVRAAFGASEKG